MHNTHLTCMDEVVYEFRKQLCLVACMHIYLVVRRICTALGSNCL